MGSLRKSQIEYLRSVKKGDLLQYMNRWRMVNDLKKLGIDISDSVWLKKEVVRGIYQAVLDNIDYGD